MYTGITRGTFPIVAVEAREDLITYGVELDEKLVAGLELGASVSIDGVCQSVVAVEGTVVTFDVIRETLDLTTLDALEVGRLVGVERSARYGDEVGGHEMAGHIIGTGEVALCRREGDDVSLEVTVPADWMRFILHKGFIGVDGCSLTVGRTWPEGRFSLHLIPETLRLTNLGRKEAGSRVNIELDPKTVAIVETVERVMAERQRQGA